MRKLDLKTTMRFENECTNWHVGEIKVRYKEKKIPSIVITSGSDVFSFILKNIDVDAIQVQEHTWAIFLNNAQEVIGFKTIGMGNLTKCTVNPKLILCIALLLNAHSIIFCHNHPSGNLTPSSVDIKFTVELKNAAKLIDVQLFDHVVITKRWYFSLREKHILNFD